MTLATAATGLSSTKAILSLFATVTKSRSQPKSRPSWILAGTFLAKLSPRRSGTACNADRFIGNAGARPKSGPVSRDALGIVGRVPAALKGYPSLPPAHLSVPSLTHPFLSLGSTAPGWTLTRAVWWTTPAPLTSAVGCTARGACRGLGSVHPPPPHPPTPTQDRRARQLVTVPNRAWLHALARPAPPLDRPWPPS